MVIIHTPLAGPWARADDGQEGGGDSYNEEGCNDWYRIAMIKDNEERTKN